MNPETVELLKQVFLFILYFAVVVGLVILATRFMAGRFSAQRKGRHLQVIESVSLTQKSAICLARVAGRVMVLGVSEQGISHLATLDQKEAAVVSDSLKGTQAGASGTPVGGEGAQAGGSIDGHSEQEFFQESPKLAGESPFTSNMKKRITSLRRLGRKE